MFRRCAVCKKKLIIKVYPDKHYKGGHFFGKPKIPIGKGKYEKVGVWKFMGKECSIVTWTGREKKIEMWECDECYQEALNEYWLENKIERLYGKRCPDYEKECGCCQAWSVYNMIIADNRGEL